MVKTLRLLEFNPYSFLYSHLKSLLEERAVISIVVILSLCAYGFLAVQHTVAGDEWAAFHLTDYQDVWSIQIGRWMAPLVRHILADNALAPTVTLSIFIFGQLISFLICVRVIGLKDSFAVFGLLATTMFFPFWAEAVNFRLLHGQLALGLLFSVSYGAVGWRAFRFLACDRNLMVGILLTGLGAIFFSFANSLYQGVGQFGLILIFAAAINRLVLAAPPIGAKQISVLVIVVAGIILFGSAMYALEVAATQWIFKIPPASGDYALSESVVGTIPEMTENVRRALAYMGAFLFYPTHLFPISTKVIFLAVLTTVISTVIIFSQGAWLKFGLALICLLGIFAAPWAIGLVRTPNSYRYLAIISASLCYGAIFGLALEHCRIPLIRGALQLGTIAVVLIFVFQQNMASVITFENNRRDVAVTNRLLARIENLPEYRLIDRSQPVTLVPVGTPQFYVGRPFAAPHRSGVMNDSIISCGIYSCQIFRMSDAFVLLSADSVRYDVKPISAFDEPIRAEATGMPNWPGLGSVIFADKNVVLIKFGEDGG
jgi:Glucosyl transferase GtrII